MNNLGMTNPAANPVQVQNTIVRPVRISEGPQIQPESTREPVKAPPVELENVISVSEDGDTVQASQTSLSKLEEKEPDDRVVVKQQNEDNAISEKKPPKPSVEEPQPLDVRTESMKPPILPGENAESRAEAAETDNERLEQIEAMAGGLGAAAEVKPTPQPEIKPVTAPEIAPVEDKKPELPPIGIERNAVIQEKLKPVETEEPENPVIEEAKKAAAEVKEKNPVIEENNNKSNVSSFVGFSNAQLKELYLKGDISRRTYESELESRDTEKEFLQEMNRSFAKDMGNKVAVGEKVTRDEQELKIVFSEDSSDKIDPRERIKIMDTLENIEMSGVASVALRR